MLKTFSLIFFISLNFNVFAQERVAPSFNERFQSLDITSQYFKSSLYNLYNNCVAEITNDFYSCDNLSVEFISQNTEFSESIMNTCTLPMLNSTLRRGAPLEELSVAPINRNAFHKEVLSTNRNTVSTVLTNKLQNQCGKTGYIEVIGIDSPTNNRDASYRMKVTTLTPSSNTTPTSADTPINHQEAISE